MQGARAPLSPQRRRSLVGHPAKGAALGEAAAAAGRAAEHGSAVAADNHGLGVAEHDGDVEAAGAVDVHEELLMN